MKLIKKAKWAYIIVSVAITVLGLVLVLFPEISAMTVCYMVGIIIMVFGIVKLLGYFSKDLYRLAFQFDFALGIFSLVAGILVLLHPTNIVALMPVIMGVFVLMDGAFKLQTAFDARRFGMKQWWSILLLALLTCVGGLFLIINPFAGAQALMVLLGITLMVEGIQNLCIVAYTVKAVHSDYRDDIVFYK